MTDRTESKLREEIAELGKSLFERGMSAGSSGNISVRLDDGWLLTPTNSCLGRLDPARIAKLGPDGRHLAGDPPSKELFLHGAMYAERASAKAIVHLHSTHSVAVSCLPEVDPDDVLPPLTAYYVMKIGRLPLVPYYRPGDMALGEAIRGYAAKTHALLLANHGPIVAGTSLEDAVYAMEE
ncbi:MAG: 3-oxo-tetronate 4-phosphate decarboxylase, partial [Kiloniellales bacterium]